jgi:hypoxanthine phosphoribosyltransferase
LQYLFISWERLEELLAALATSIRKRGLKPDIIVGVSRGGLVPTRLISDFLNIRDVIVLGVAFYEDLGKTSSQPRITHPLTRDIRGKKVLLLDDVSDTGGSLELAKEHVLSFNPSELVVCTLHRKPWSTFRPDIFVEETDRWIIYPWEKVEAGMHILCNMKTNQNREVALSDVGFSRGDLRLLGDLEILGSDPDPPRRKDDGTKGG